jgi:hypothetical protein
MLPRLGALTVAFKNFSVSQLVLGAGGGVVDTWTLGARHGILATLLAEKP